MGPWRAAQQFVNRCHSVGVFDAVVRVRVDLYGSLAKTGRGHGTDIAVLLGLSDVDPVTCDTAQIHSQVAAIQASGKVELGGSKVIPFEATRDLIFNRAISLPRHPNALTFTAFMEDGRSYAETYYSIGGGFVVRDGADQDVQNMPADSFPFPITSAVDLLSHCCNHGLSIPEVVWRNECTVRSPEEIHVGVEGIWSTMRSCAFRGAHTAGMLPGGLAVVRREAMLNHTLLGNAEPQADRNTVETWIAAIRSQGNNFPEVLKWVSCFALAVNEENASFGRVVTAPTNGAAGVIPAVLLYRVCFHEAGDQAVEPFLLTAGVVGALFKRKATLSAAMGGCQAEIGVSSAMAAAGLAQSLGGSPEQVLMAAEIAMEHHLGLTCDPVGGLVQIPCIGATRWAR